MRSRMQSFALGDGALEIPHSTLFIEDTDVIGPTTSSSLSQHPSLTQQLTPAIDLSVPVPVNTDESGMVNFVKGFFADGTAGFFQPKAETNFIEEIFAEKQPKIVGDYLFGHAIGEGSYSRVKEVLHIKTLVRRAVKIIKDKKLRKIPGGVQNVQQEIEVHQRIDHKNIVKLIDIFRIEEKQKLYIVMEFCVCSLQQLLENSLERILPEFQAHLYFTQILNGLDHLHTLGIIHKDIKPGNLLLSLEGVVKICDLGVAEILFDPNDDWCTLAQGTPKFQPPEVVSGLHKRFRGKQVDIWSLGVTLYNFISADYPFDGDGILKLFENITNQPLKMPQNVIISKELVDLLTHILSKDPETRWNSLNIHSCEWFTKKHEIVQSKIVQVPPIKDIQAHRPLGVCRALEQLFGCEEDDDHSVSVREPKKKPSESLIVQRSFASLVPTSSAASAFQDGVNFSLVDIQRNQNEMFLSQPSEEVAVEKRCLSKERNRRNPRPRLIARLRQIFFLTMCILLVCVSTLILWLMF